MDSFFKDMLLIIFGIIYLSVQIVMGGENLINGTFTNWLKKYWAKSTDFGKKILFLIFIINIPCLITTFCLRIIYRIILRLLYEIGIREDK